VTCIESVIGQRPGSADVDELSEKDQREASPIIDAFDHTVVCCYMLHVFSQLPHEFVSLMCTLCDVYVESGSFY